MKDKLLNIGDFKDTPIKQNFKNDLEMINVKITQMPTLEDIKKYSTDFLLSTWSNTVNYNTSHIEDLETFENALLLRAFQGKFLPTFMESININVQFSGINWHDVTHLLRYRQMSFAGDCSGDKVIINRNIGVPDAIVEKGLEEKYKKACTDLCDIYEDMIHDERVAIQDARLALPRTIETFYNVRMTLGDAMKFIMHRLDEQVQPKADNIMALQMLVQLCEQIPLLSLVLDYDQPNWFYINENDHIFRSAFFAPNVNNEKHIAEDITFNYDKRDNLLGNETYYKLKKDLVEKFKTIKSKALVDYKDVLNYEFDAEEIDKGLR